MARFKLVGFEDPVARVAMQQMRFERTVPDCSMWKFRLYRSMLRNDDEGIPHLLDAPEVLIRQEEKSSAQRR